MPKQTNEELLIDAALNLSKTGYAAFILVSVIGSIVNASCGYTVTPFLFGLCTAYVACMFILSGNLWEQMGKLESEKREFYCRKVLQINKALYEMLIAIPKEYPGFQDSKAGEAARTLQEMMGTLEDEIDKKYPNYFKITIDKIEE